MLEDGPEPFGRYQLLTRIATGGMAELFLASQTTIDGVSKIVALKRMLPHLERSSTNIRMFLEEARLAAKLDHPNVVRIYELGEVERRHFISMEYLPGEDLAQIIARSGEVKRPIPIDVAIALVRDVAKGLHYAHQLADDRGIRIGLVHRDISPSNILLTYQGAAKIIDFGLAKGVNAIQRTRTGFVRGKLGYFAPEQLQRRDVDRRTDVFALGLVLFELLTGQPAFRGETEAEILALVAKGEVRSARKERADIPAELQHVLDRSLEPDRSARYSSALALHDALNLLMNERGADLSAATLSAWLADLFGPDRAALKLALSEGRELSRNVRDLVRRNADDCASSSSYELPIEPPARSVLRRASIRFATGLAGRITPEQPFATQDLSPAFEAPPRQSQHTTVLAFLGCGLALLAAVLTALPFNGQGDHRDIQPASLTIDSDPPGAAIFIDGRPIGLKTPAEIPALRPGTPIDVSVKKRGFAGTGEPLVLRPGAAEKRKYILEPTSAFLNFVGVATDVIILVDGVRVSGRESLEVGPGTHQLRLERGTEILKQRTIELAPGEEHEVRQ